MYLYTCIITYIYSHKYVYTHTWIHTHICTPIYSYVYKHRCVYEHIYTGIYTHLCMYTCLNIYDENVVNLKDSLTECLCRVSDHMLMANRIHTHTHTHTTNTYLLQSWFGWAKWVHVTLWLSKEVGWSPVLLNEHTQAIQLSWESQSMYCTGEYRLFKHLLQKSNRGCKSDL